MGLQQLELAFIACKNLAALGQTPRPSTAPSSSRPAADGLFNGAYLEEALDIVREKNREDRRRRKLRSRPWQPLRRRRLSVDVITRHQRGYEKQLPRDSEETEGVQ